LLDPAGVTGGAFGEGVLDDQSALFTSFGSGGDPSHNTESNIFSVKADYEFGSHTLTSQTAYVGYDLSFEDDFDFSLVDWINFLRDEVYQQYTQELRLTSPSGEPFEYMVGLFYLDSTWKSQEQQLYAVPGFPPAGGPPPGQLFNGPFTNNFRQGTESISAFASGTWNITDQFRVNAGIRFVDESKDVMIGRTASEPFTVWNQIANPPFPNTPLSFSEDFIDGNFSLQYDVADNAMIYAAYGRGTKTGGWVETNTVSSGDPETGAFIGTEKTDTIEAGVKSFLFDRTVMLNAAVFYTDITDFQDTTFTGAEFITLNVPTSTQGVELETAWQVSDALRFNLAATYADAQATINGTDFRAVQAPLWTVNAGLDFEDNLTDSLLWNWRVGVDHRSRMFNQRGELFEAEAFTPLSFGIGIEPVDGKWSIDLSARNITDETTADFSSPSPNPVLPGLAGPAAFRTVTLSFSIRG
jgi:iron complex outermembrane receptor protein